MLTDYTDQQSRYDAAFSTMATCCSVTCEACGRSYFVTSPGHGDYEDGELDDLRQRAAKEPDRCIEVPDYSSVAVAIVQGKQVVIGCECDPTKGYADWIETYAEQLTEYLRLYWEAERQEAKASEERSVRCLAVLSDMMQTRQRKEGD